MTEEEFREAALCGYGDIMILKAVAEKEKYQINLEDRVALIESTAEYVGMSVEETLNTYGEEYLDCLLYEEFLKKLILSNYRPEITEMMSMWFRMFSEKNKSQGSGTCFNLEGCGKVSPQSIFRVYSKRK